MRCCEPGVKLVYAPDSWSGFRSAPRLTSDARSSWDFVDELVLLPMTDGGQDATLALRHLASGVRQLEIDAPQGDGRLSALALQLDEDSFFLESARVLGRAFAGDPRTASSRGLGQALKQLARHDGLIVVGLGGSGTMDGGLGLAQGLGLWVEGAPEHAGAVDLERATGLHGPAPLPDRLVAVWADVRTPLLDSARVFGPQKGADELFIERNTRDLERWAVLVNDWRRRQGRAPLPLDLPGGGAAGGLGWSLAALLDAHLVPGSRAAGRMLSLDEALRGADVLVTGEGRFDASSLDGKVVGHVLERARAQGVPRQIVLCGSRDPEVQPPGVEILSCEELFGSSRSARYQTALDQLATTLF